MGSRAVRSIGILIVAVGLAPPSLGASSGLPLTGEEAETFLRGARVVSLEPLPVGVSQSQKALLTDGSTTLEAVWKIIDIYRHKMRFEDGTFELDFRDTYKHEVAAYELAKLLGLDLVPPTVERRMGRQVGSMQLWVEGAMTEFQRRQQGRRPENLPQWNRQMHHVRLFHQLTYNTDYKNMQNVLVTDDFRLFAIDHSRAFRTTGRLLADGKLERFSRSVLEALRQLDGKLLDRRLGRWLTPGQIKALLKRRDLILHRAQELLAERGEEAVLFP